MLGFFVLVIAMNGYMAYLAIRSYPGVEVRSSFRAGNEYNRVIAAAEAQAARRWHVDVRIERDGTGSAALRFEPRDASGASIDGLDVAVRLQRPADSALDRSAELSARGGGIYVARVVDVAAGQWDVIFEARRGSEVVYRSRNRVILQ
jgi:nitrogen fixation protein FixH